MWAIFENVFIEFVTILLLIFVCVCVCVCVCVGFLAVMDLSSPARDQNSTPSTGR